MDNYSLLANLVDSLAWPVTVLGMCVLFRREISKLFERITKFRYGDSEIDFEKRVERVSKEAGTNLPALGKSEEAARSRLYELAKASPRGAIIDSWLGVESELKKYAMRNGISSELSSFELLRSIEFHSLELGKLGGGIIHMLYKLLSLRDEAAHLTDSSIDTNTAIEFVDLAWRVQNRLEEA